jgi:hypothetical protein
MNIRLTILGGELAASALLTGCASRAMSDIAFPRRPRHMRWEQWATLPVQAMCGPTDSGTCVVPAGPGRPDDGNVRHGPMLFGCGRIGSPAAVPGGSGPVTGGVKGPEPQPPTMGD